MRKGDKKNSRKSFELNHPGHSLRAEITVLFILLMLGAIALCIFLNQTFLGQYYVRNKEKALQQTYESINAAIREDSIGSDSFDAVLRKNAGRDNIGVLVVDPNSQVTKSYSVDQSALAAHLYNNLFGSQEAGSYQILRKTDDTILMLVMDDVLQTRFMELWGKLDNGYYFLLQTPVESIRESSRIANRFFIYVGLMAITLGVVASFIMGSRVTKPIRQITNISEHMKRFDFSEKYTGRSTTEVGELGRNINELSDTMEQFISELKSKNTELQNEVKQKEEIDAMRKEFLSNVTHELKTPIALIQGYAEGLQDFVDSDQETRDFYAGVIVDEAKKMNTMVQKLLSLNHLEFGTETVNVEHFDIVDLIRRYLSQAGILADKKDVTVRFPAGDAIDENGDPVPVMVWGDSFLMEEVFTNYFSNALNHVEVPENAANEKVIDISITPKPGKVRVTVFNTGKPIPEESLPHIWEKFYKVDKARTRAYGGSGIGLSIVKAIMDLVHEAYGVINYDNGVAFWFEMDTENKPV